jgi:hypothetical protein
VFLVLAANSLFACFTAAPPHFATPFTLMEFAAPVEVFLLLKLEVAILARFGAGIELAFPLNQFLDTSFVLVSLRHQMLALFFQFFDFQSLCVVLITLLLKLDLKPSNLLLVRHVIDQRLISKLLLSRQKLLRLIPKLVTLRHHHVHILVALNRIFSVVPVFLF